MGAADARLRPRPTLTASLPCTVAADGITLALRLTPRAARDAIGGIVDDADGRPLLRVRLAAPPVEGAANRALVALLAAGFALRKADVTIRAGETGRVKRVHLAGDPPALLRRLGELVPAAT